MQSSFMIIVCSRDRGASTDQTLDHSLVAMPTTTQKGGVPVLTSDGTNITITLIQSLKQDFGGSMNTLLYTYIVFDVQFCTSLTKIRQHINMAVPCTHIHNCLTSLQIMGIQCTSIIIISNLVRPGQATIQSYVQRGEAPFIQIPLMWSMDCLQSSTPPPPLFPSSLGKHAFVKRLSSSQTTLILC